jgi:hypothetical protein
MHRCTAAVDVASNVNGGFLQSRCWAQTSPLVCHFRVLDRVRGRLGREQIGSLLNLPATVMLAVDGLGEVFFCHATPHNDTDFFTDATPRSGGAYVNMMMEEGEERIQATYRGNYERLAQVKRKYDPSNLFHVNQNIRPA